MPLSDDEKLIRKKVVGSAVQLLRHHMGISQLELGRLVHDTDPMNVSKWERGVVVPHPHKRDRLAEIARKNGRRDLEDAFINPVENWKVMLPGNLNYVGNLITLLEICTVNEHIASLRPNSDDLYYVTLNDIAGMIKDRLIERAKRGEPVVLLNDRQRHFWFETLKERGIYGPKKIYAKTQHRAKKTR
jgi:transcriptional regulator with XRE-family HTH domain